MEEQRIEHGADIVHHAVAHDLDGAGFAIDLQLAAVGPVREVLDLGAIDCGDDQPRLHARWQLSRVGGEPRDLLKVSVSLVADAENTPSAKLTRAGSAFRAKAAMARALSITLRQAASTAAPPSVAVREPPVPSPKNT